MFKKIKTKKLSETIDQSWEAQEKFQAKIREELRKKLVNMRNNETRLLAKLREK